jgi:aldehyde dehydrogenase (NAD+)
MDTTKIRELIHNHRAFFATGRTRDLSFRREQLRRLKEMFRANESTIFEALRLDLKKPAVEAYGGDVAIVINEIDHALKHLACWAKPRRARTPIAFFPARSRVLREPYGLALIIAPWNFPFQLTFAPLVGAIAAGNCALLKPPIAAPHSERLIAKLVADYFDPAYISVAEGGAETAEALLAERFDYIFFTGGVATGRRVMQAAAKHLTPLTLELGGKNPCIVDTDVRLDIAAQRIVWGKYFNAGQSCMAVDYLLVDRRIKQALLDRITQTIAEFYGKDPEASPDYGRIVDDGHFKRLVSLIDGCRIEAGGRTNPASRYIAPTILDGVSMNSPIMEEEIFGPLLPVIEYDDLSQAIGIVNSRPRPLALYIFSADRAKQERMLREIPAGGGCINDTAIHETAGLPFGGVGESGMGRYHGRASFETFSHERSVVTNTFLFDIKLRYPPYEGKLAWIRKLF